METIGVIGLGAMGAPMAWNVADAGFDLVVYNRTTERTVEFADAGVAVADSPQHLTEQCDVVVLMVTDGDAVADVLERELGVLAGLDEGTTVVQMSTIAPAETAAAAEQVRERGATFVDAPVFGTVGPAEEGTLTVFPAGDRETVESLGDLFDALGETVIYAGEVGQGTNLKLTVNLLLGDVMTAFSEALSFGVARDLDPGDVLAAVESGPVDSTLFRVKGASILEGDYAPHFPAGMQHKDLSLALAAAGEEGLSLPLTAAAREAYSAALGRGYGADDMSSVVRHYLETSDLEIGEN